jgi:hypothetical protein
MPRHHQRLRARFALGKSAINYQLVQTNFLRRHVAQR